MKRAAVDACRSEKADLCALGFFAGYKVFGLMALVKDYAAVKRGAATPVHDLLQPPLAFHLRDEGCVGPAG